MFVTEEDYLPYIKDSNLQRMIEADDTIRLDAEATAEAVIRDALAARYDADAVFAAAGNDRSRQIVRWVVVLALYYMYERLPANVMPARVKDNYQEVMGFLKDLEDGKKPMVLPQKNDDDTGLPITKFRGGSVLPKRTHDYF